MGNQTILITGGAGFIGSGLTEVLLRADARVLASDNFDSFYPRNIKERNLQPYRNHPKFSFHEGDIRDEKFLDNLFSQQKIDLVVHLAAKAGVRPSIANPVEYFDVNVNGTLKLLEAMKRHHTSKLVFSSSSSVYGNNKKIPYAEDDNVDFPISPYAASKKAGELITHTYHHLSGMDVINLRFFTVYGPKQRPDLAIHKFFKCAYDQTPIDFYGDGSTSRDYTYIDDITQGIAAAASYLLGNTGVYETVNLGNSNPIRLSELVSLIEKVTGKQIIKHMLPMQEGDVNSTFADISKAKSLLQYKPSTGIEQGLRKFNEWYVVSHG